MIKKTIFVLIAAAAFFHFTAFVGNVKVNELGSSQTFREEIIGIWRIDSIAENRKVIQRPYKETLGFHFKEDGTCNSVEIGSRVTKTTIMGNWEIDIDSLSILGEYAPKAMKYKYELSKSKLVLSGNINSSDRAEVTTFYFSKFRK